MGWTGTILPSMGLTPPPIVWSSRRIPPPMGLTPPPMVWSSRPIPPPMGTTPHPLSLGSVTQPGLRVPRPLVVTATDKGRDDCLKVKFDFLAI